MSVKNLVQCPLITPVSSTATELLLGAVSAPYSLPPLDGGILVIADSVGKPSFVEFIKYTHRIDNVLYGVSRGQEETTARNWSGVTYVYQALTADQYTSELARKVDKVAGQSLMTDAERTKLGGIQAGAQVNTVTSVAGKTGAVSLTKADVGLGNVDNTSDANKPISTATQTALNAKAPLASPVFTGTPSVPTPAAGTNTTQIANTAFVQAALAALVNGAPGALNQLNELAAAMGNDPNFATTMLNALALKAPLESPAFTGNPTAPTPAAEDADTSIATTAFVRAAMALFGVGANMQEWPSTTLNDFTVPTGFYRAPASVTDTPFPDYWGVAIEKAPSGAYVRQSTWCLNSATRIFERIISGGVVVPWRELFHTGNILGTVSQVGGVPTGAIIERGSNANGEYVRFADGTQICTYNVAGAQTMVAYGGLYRCSLTWTFPALFVTAPSISGGGVDQSLPGWVGGSEGNGFVASIVYFTGSATVTATNIRFIAIGRWN